MKFTSVNKRLFGLLAAGTITLSLVGCGGPTELADDVEGYDVLDTTVSSKNGSELEKGITQTLDVNGEDFKLIIKYYSEDGRDWKITADKKLYMSILTEGLPSNKRVYIDTIHMDTSLVSTKAYLDGILQDTLDDHIHNSLMLGFPISDTSNYFGINVIEGQNSEFISGYTYGYQGFSSGSVAQERRLESDFLEKGVWANKISGAVGLLIENIETGEIRGVDVDTTLIIQANNQIVFQNGNKLITYEYDKKGNKTKISKEKIETAYTK